MKYLLFIITFFCALFPFSTNAQVIKGDFNLEDSTQVHIIHTKDGDRLMGRVLEINGSQLVLLFKGSSRLNFDLGEVETIEVLNSTPKAPAEKPVVETPPSSTPLESSDVKLYPDTNIKLLGDVNIRDRTQRHLVRTVRGEEFTGQVRIISPRSVRLRLDNSTTLTFRTESVESIQLLTDSDIPVPTATNDEEIDLLANISLLDTSEVHVLLTKRGDQFVGRVVGVIDEKIRFQINPSTILTFLKEDIQSLTLQAEGTGVGLMPDYFIIDRIPPNGYQHLFITPTGFNFNRGEGEYKNTELFLNTVDYGLSDNFSLGAGIIPLLVANIFVVKGKLSFSVSEHLHISAGGQIFAGFSFINTDDGIGASLFHGSLTIGSPDKFLNFSYARWIPFNDDLDANVLGLGGAFRIGEKGRIFGDIIRVNEIEYDNQYTMSMFGGSWFNAKNRFDFGFFAIPEYFGDGPVLFPIAGYARKIQ